MCQIGMINIFLFSSTIQCPVALRVEDIFMASSKRGDNYTLHRAVAFVLVQLYGGAADVSREYKEMGDFGAYLKRCCT